MSSARSKLPPPAFGAKSGVSSAPRGSAPLPVVLLGLVEQHLELLWESIAQTKINRLIFQGAAAICSAVRQTELQRKTEYM